MSRWVARHILILAAVAACNRDKEPVQTDSANSPAPPAANTKAQPQGAAARPAARPAPDPNAAAAAELASATHVRTVQVAAFPRAAMAQWWVSKLQGAGVPAYATTATVNGEEVSRLRIGAAITGAEARALAAKIHADYQWPTWITMVEDKSALSGAMLTASRSYATRP